MYDCSFPFLGQAPETLQMMIKSLIHWVLILTQTKCIDVIKLLSYSVTLASMLAGQLGLARFAVIKTLRGHETAVWLNRLKKRP